MGQEALVDAWWYLVDTVIKASVQAVFTRLSLPVPATRVDSVCPAVLCQAAPALECPTVNYTEVAEACSVQFKPRVEVGLNFQLDVCGLVIALFIFVSGVFFGRCSRITKVSSRRSPQVKGKFVSAGVGEF